MKQFDWQVWFGRFEIQINDQRMRMQGDQLQAAMKELTDAVGLATTAAQNHTPDAVVIPIVQQISGLAAALKQAFPQPQG